MMKLVGIIQAPLSAFTYDPRIGRGQLDQISSKDSCECFEGHWRSKRYSKSPLLRFHFSNDRPKQDARGEAVAAGIDAGFVYSLKRRARRLGFSSPKIESGLAGKQPVCRVLFDVPDRQVDAKWKCGKPGLCAFLHLQEHAFLADLISVNGADGLVPMFVFRDFMDAFFCGFFFVCVCVEMTIRSW
ncbi:hypothetical protein LZ30DRAFT_742593 [Colletotrichum cereale]|nr:hypothetical protein LZ30DRAFT_742593 [Colletotrichum cereale]